MVKPYPLKALERMRGERRDEALRAVARRSRETESRQRAVDAVVDAGAQLSNQTQSIADRERERAEQRGSRVLDWQRLGAHEVGARNELQSLERREELERERLGVAASDERAARRKLLECEVDAATLAEHRERFEATERARAELALEDEALEQYRPRGR